MKTFLLGILTVLALIGAGAAYVWHYSPDSLPAEWRRENPHSRDYAPVVYRWRDAQGVTQLTDAPPAGRPFETVHMDPNRNVVPTTLPRGTPPPPAEE